MKDDLMTVDDVAEALRVSKATARTCMGQMERVNISLGSRPVWRVTEKAFNQWLNSRTVDQKHCKTKDTLNRVPGRRSTWKS